MNRDMFGIQVRPLRFAFKTGNITGNDTAMLAQVCMGEFRHSLEASNDTW